MAVQVWLSKQETLWPLPTPQMHLFYCKFTFTNYKPLDDGDSTFASLKNESEICTRSSTCITIKTLAL